MSSPRVQRAGRVTLGTSGANRDHRQPPPPTRSAWGRFVICSEDRSLPPVTGGPGGDASHRLAQPPRVVRGSLTGWWPTLASADQSHPGRSAWKALGSRRGPSRFLGTVPRHRGNCREARRRRRVGRVQTQDGPRRLPDAGGRISPDQADPRARLIGLDAAHSEPLPPTSRATRPGDHGLM